jgi:hypothetical protein
VRQSPRRDVFRACARVDAGRANRIGIEQPAQRVGERLAALAEGSANHRIDLRRERGVWASRRRQRRQSHHGGFDFWRRPE